MNANLKHLRIARGLLLKDAAVVVGTDPGNLSRIEQGKQCPSLPLARRLAAMYEISLDQVFGVRGDQSDAVIERRTSPKRRSTDYGCPDEAA